MISSRLSITTATSIVRSNNNYCIRTILTDERQRRLYPSAQQEFTDEGFPILKVMPSKRRAFDEKPKLTIKRRQIIKLESREEKFKENIDWPSYWPTAKTFSPSAVPLPLRQSYENKKYNTPKGKYTNTELVKIPNFLHLTPGAIERQCKALMQFCTKWPENLDTDEEVRSHFPLTYITRDYVHSSPTIREPRSRVVEIKFNIKDLKLKPRDEDKMIRLARYRFDKDTNEISIKASACPLRVQNIDYGNYLITALYFESIKHEKWEDDKPECDWERFFWEKSQSKEKIKEYLNVIGTKVRDVDIEKGEGLVRQYKEAVERVFLKEDYQNLEAYRHGVEKLLGVQINK